MVALKKVLSNELMSSFATVMTSLYKYSQENEIPDTLQKLLEDDNIKNFMEVDTDLKSCTQQETLNFFTKCIIDHTLGNIRAGDSWEHLNKMTGTRVQQFVMPNIKRAINHAIKAIISEELSIKTKEISRDEAELLRVNAIKDCNKYKSSNDNINTTENIHSKNCFRSVLRGVDAEVHTNTSVQNSESLQPLVENIKKNVENTTIDRHFSSHNCTSFHKSNTDCQKITENDEKIGKDDISDFEEVFSTGSIVKSCDKTISNNEIVLNNYECKSRKTGRRKFSLEKAENNKNLLLNARKESELIQLLEDSLSRVDNVHYENLKAVSIAALKNSSEFAESIEILRSLKSEGELILLKTTNRTHKEKSSIIEKNDEIISQAESYMQTIFGKEIKLTLFTAKRILKDMKINRDIQDETPWSKSKKILESYLVHSAENFSLCHQDVRFTSQIFEDSSLSKEAGEYFSKSFSDYIKKLCNLKNNGFLIKNSDENLEKISQMRRKDRISRVDVPIVSDVVELTFNDPGFSEEQNGAKDFYNSGRGPEFRKVQFLVSKKPRRLTVAQRWKKLREEQRKAVEAICYSEFGVD